MEILQNRFSLQVGDGCFPLSTDSMVLSDFVRLKSGARVLDLGSGCGTLGLLLCAGNEGCTVTGVEIEEKAHLAALENIRANGLEHRLHSICGDLRECTPGIFDCCVSNPPYYTGGPASTLNPTARRDDNCTAAELFQAAARQLRFGGDFYLVHKPEKLAHLCACGAENALEAKRLRLIRHRENGPVTLILLQFRKGAKPGLVLEEEFLHHAGGEPSDYYKKIYHLG